MAKVSAMDPKLVGTSYNREGTPLRRQVSDAHSHGSAGLTDSADGVSPRSMPLTPECFVVTPDGKSLPGVREIHIDSSGNLLVVDRPAPALLMFDDPSHADSPKRKEVPLVRFGNSPFADTPVDSIPLLSETNKTVPLLEYEKHMMLTWPSYNNTVEEEGLLTNETRRSIKIVKMDSQGVGHVIEIRRREYEHTLSRTDEEEHQYIVEKNGTIHHAHKVFVDTGDSTEVVIREDAIPGGIYDDVPTPEIVLGPQSELVFISELGGPCHLGTPCFISCVDGAKAGQTLVFYRVALFPSYFPRSAFRKTLTYTAPLLLEMNKTRPDETFGSVAVCDDAGKVVEMYDRIILADGKGGPNAQRLVLGYQARRGGDYCLVSEDGVNVKVVSTRDSPPFSKHQDMVIICTKHKTCFIGGNVMIAGPQGLTPVAHVFDTTVDDAPIKTQVGGCGIACVPGMYPVVGLPSGICPFLLISHRPTLLLTHRTKRPYFPKAAICPTKVYICDCSGPLFPTLYPAKDELYDGVLIGLPSGAVKKGHSV